MFLFTSRSGACIVDPRVRDRCSCAGRAPAPCACALAWHGANSTAVLHAIAATYNLRTMQHATQREKVLTVIRVQYLRHATDAHPHPLLLGRRAFLPTPGVRMQHDDDGAVVGRMYYPKMVCLSMAACRPNCTCLLRCSPAAKDAARGGCLHMTYRVHGTGMRMPCREQLIGEGREDSPAAHPLQKTRSKTGS